MEKYHLTVTLNLTFGSHDEHPQRDGITEDEAHEIVQNIRHQLNNDLERGIGGITPDNDLYLAESTIETTLTKPVDGYMSWIEMNFFSGSSNQKD